ncbi:helix-turn-helix transcriptional regulator [Propionibacteriaceae bacterium G1746]|uniref:helix-turn-helix transcriptional regulator n=1 Tax=Aestuariimicrobium sp. G57 TaxID=3418485 RepID=UPI003C1665E8
MSTALGPTPLISQSAITPARAKVARALADAATPPTLAELVTTLGGHPNTTRAHLDALATAGLATVGTRATPGRGRPASTWQLTDHGRRALAGDPAITTHVEVMTAIAAHLDDLPDGPDRAHRIGHDWGRQHQLDGSPAQLLPLLDGLGFSPAGDGDVVRLLTCPLLGSAREYPAVVCGLHAGLIAGATGRDDLALEPFAEPGACRVVHRVVHRHADEGPGAMPEPSECQP